MSRLQRKAIKLGLEKVLENPEKYFGNKRIGLICNQATVNHQFQHAADLFFEHPGINLTTLFGPQHGIRGDVQDNMIETGHTTDPQTELPIYSLYSETRQPTEKMLENIDLLVFDLQDVGTRVYTFIYTMANAMKACAKFGKKFVVLDRPNPINGVDVEGNILELGHESFVGMFPIPMRHGMTIGELAQLFNEDFELHCDLTVVKMDGWSREDYADETDCPWVMPSPNMPTVDTAVVFPGTVYFEGTLLSEGRGTTRPFEIIGAGYINSKVYCDALTDLNLAGVIFRPIGFIPTFQKEAGKACGGAFIHVTDRNSFKPVITGIALAKIAFDLYPNDFKWKNTPYEYVFDRNPFDVIHGSTKLREAFEQGKSVKEIQEMWTKGEQEFIKQREP
ncbi:MAG TPA: DUF1343 domain-containing protein, partial [Pyrinomonadaceae bacterium]|nr:DUF1343 domain-containing protein [Pyrinomonadaceae bacterium]